MYDIVNNPIPKSGLFATPESTDALTAYIEQMNGSERALAYTIAMMTFNLSNKLVEDNILNKEVFAQ
jgi:hypothetical protein